LPPAATQHLGPECGSEQSLHVRVCDARIEDRYELFRLVDGSRPPLDYFCDPENLGAEILFVSLGTPLLFLGDAHVLPKTERCFRDANAPPFPGRLQPLLYCENVRIGDSRGRYANRRVNGVIVDLDKFRQKINISVVIFIYKIFVDSIANCAMHSFHGRTLQLGVSTHLKLNASSTRNIS